jgi:hypothetical protein
MVTESKKISLQLIEPGDRYGRLPLWEASIPQVASVRFRAKKEEKRERAQAELEMVLEEPEPEHDWRWRHQ